MQIKFSNRGNTLIVAIIGELDHHTAEYVRCKIDSELIKATSKNVIFDFQKVGFMDSSGIGVLMGRYKYILQLNGKASIINLNPQIKRIFEMSGLLKFIPLYDNINDALNAS
ncbi:MAG TPA: anti-sigma F factor antagonist [Clostridia bacterium]|nr:anti-sigma F factor antagonist [Clostridia bacterium]